jgi:hypothetical protein
MTLFFIFYCILEVVYFDLGKNHITFLPSNGRGSKTDLGAVTVGFGLEERPVLWCVLVRMRFDLHWLGLPGFGSGSALR